MQAIRTLIVDDEPLARENLRLRLATETDFEIVEECAGGRETVAAVARLRPDLLFIDIRMPDLDGFAAIEQIPPAILPVIVFVTAYDSYALDAFRVHALDYLLKPIEDERFAETLDICRARVSEARQVDAGAEPLYRFTGGLATSPGGQATPERLVIKTRGRVFFLRTTAIDWIEANGDYSRIHVDCHSYLLRKTMNEMAARLGPPRFARISRSAIVNLDRVQELLPVARGEFMVRLPGDRQLKLTRTYRDQLEALLGDRL